MEIKNTLVVSDLDGTLLNSEKNIDLETIKTINSLIKKGLKFTFATSRPFMIVKKYYEIIETDIPVIVSSGSMIYDLKKKGLLYSNTLNKDVIKIVLENDIKQKIVFHSNKGMIMSDKNPRYKQFIKEDYTFKPLDIEKYDLSNIECGQISILPEYVLEEGINKYKELLKNYDVRVFDTGGAIGIVNKDVSKASGIKKLMELIGINENNVIVFGDSYNDIEMFNCFKNSYAMGNSTEEIKKLSKSVTYDNDHNGVAHALKDIFK